MTEGTILKQTDMQGTITPVTINHTLLVNICEGNFSSIRRGTTIEFNTIEDAKEFLKDFEEQVTDLEKKLKELELEF